MVHQLILTVFTGPKPTPAHIPDHLDNNPSNNHVDNLEWVTPGENIHRAYARDGRKASYRTRIGLDNNKTKLTPDIVREVRSRHASGVTITALAAQYGVSACTVGRALSGKTWAHLDTPDYKTTSSELTPLDLYIIRTQRANGWKFDILAYIFNVSPKVISDICRGYTYKDM